MPVWICERRDPSTRQWTVTARIDSATKREAAFAMFAAYYNFCWQTRKPDKSGEKRPTAAMMAKLEGHIWSFDELFEAVFSTR